MDAATRGEKGQTLVEYAMLLSFVAMAVIGMLTIFGSGLNAYYQNALDVIVSLV